MFLFHRIMSRNSDYGSYCNSPTDNPDRGDSDIQHAPLIQTSDTEEEEMAGGTRKGNNPLDAVRINIPSELNSSKSTDKIPQEPLKTLLAGLFLGTGFLVTSFSLAFTHDRYPEGDPLPDIILDNISYQHWGLDVSEYLLMISTMSAVFIVSLHKYRLIVLRRIWLLLGILYYYRAMTFFVTVLPKSDETYQCAPTSNETSVMGEFPHSALFQRLFYHCLHFRLRQTRDNNIQWRWLVNQWEACFLRRLYILRPHHDSHHGIPGHKAM